MGAKTMGPSVEAVVELTRTEKRMMQPGGCRMFMRKTLAREFEEIVKGFVEAAKTGSVPHVKLATELLKPERQGATRKKGSAARTLEALERKFGKG